MQESTELNKNAIKLSDPINRSFFAKMFRLLLQQLAGRELRWNGRKQACALMHEEAGRRPALRW